MNLELNKTYHMDCLEGMKLIPDKSIDMILCDLPYGTTRAKWDKIINQEVLWKEYRRIIKKDGAIVLTASQPFSSLLVYNNLDLYRHSWIWEKPNSSDFINANYRPMKIHEDILVFSFSGDVAPAKSKLKYFPQGLVKVNKKNRRGRNSEVTGYTNKNEYIQKYTNYPKTILRFGYDKEKYHPTQKPVSLFEYLIKTYSNEGEIVLDNCMGSGTTAVACIRSKRNYIGFESDEIYAEISELRAKMESNTEKSEEIKRRIEELVKRKAS
jgi:site-specific DNA-methyltransferase (adenine-specific)